MEKKKETTLEVKDYRKELKREELRLKRLKNKVEDLQFDIKATEKAIAFLQKKISELILSENYIDTFGEKVNAIEACVS